MRARTLVASLVLAVCAAFTPVALASPGVSPSHSDLTLAEGQSTTITKTVTTPVIPPNPDIVFLVDTTTSMGAPIGSVQSNAAAILGDIASSQPTAQFAVAQYKDADDGAAAFSVLHNLTSSQSDTQTALNNLTPLSGGGSDAPEDGINGLFQVSTGAISYRPASSRVVIWIGDSSSHDPSLGHTEADATAALQAAGIRVIALDVGPAPPPAISDGLDATGQATRITSATGGQLFSGVQPDQVSTAILAGLHNLPVTVTPQVGTCDSDLTVGLTPPSQSVTSGDDAHFTETVSVSPGATPGSTQHCSVDFLINGQHQDGFTETITNTVPRHDSHLAVDDATSDFHDPGTLHAVLTDASTHAPIGSATVSFTMGAEHCDAVTDAGGDASCSITPSEAAGTYPITATFAGDAQHNPTSGTAHYVVTREETTTTYTGPTVIANGVPTTLSGVLKEDGTTPIAGRTLTLTLGTGATAQSCTGTTNASGSASCTLTPSQPLGPGTVSAAFAGDAFYLPSSDSASTISFEFLAHGSFVIGDGNAANGTSVTFWGAQWWKANTLSGGSAPASFKGFAASTSSSPPACGQTWTTGPGNSSDPPSSVPSYMGVIVSSSVGKSGSTISGDTASIVVVHTDAGYADNPGHAGTGTVVAKVC
jgi:von Willebrand factor type A domain/Bacterial Ig-like domain (group 3)